MIILITGSNGFLGKYYRNISKHDRHSYIFGSTSDSKECVKFAKEYSDIAQVLKEKEIDVIIHFASIIPASFFESSFKKTFIPNIKMMENLFQYSLRIGVKKFIYISGFGSMIFPEVLDIKDYYTMSKITGEHYCAMMENSGINAVSLRVSSPYGEYYNGNNVLSIFTKKALKNEPIIVFGEGKREQNFTYAGDVKNAIELCLERKGSGIYNIVGSDNISMIDLARLIVKISGSKSEIKIGEKGDPQENYRPNYNYIKANKDIGYVPNFSLKQGLERYIAWLKSYENCINF